MKIPHLSVSRTGTFNTCAQQYKFKYHLGIDPCEPEKPYFLYGKVIHKIIEEYTRARGQKNINDIKREVLGGDIPLEEEAGQPVILPPDYLKRLPDELASFMKLTQKIGTDGICEWGFHHDLEPPYEKFLHGYVDRLIQKGDHIFILDYKTTKKGRWRKDYKTITTDLQLQCYAFVVMKAFNVEPKNIKAALYYLQGGELYGASFSRATLEKAEKYMLETYNKIFNLDPDNVVGNVGNHCANCPFRKICHFYSLV